MRPLLQLQNYYDDKKGIVRFIFHSLYRNILIHEIAIYLEKIHYSLSWI